VEVTYLVFLCNTGVRLLVEGVKMRHVET